MRNLEVSGCPSCGGGRASVADTNYNDYHHSFNYYNHIPTVSDYYIF